MKQGSEGHASPMGLAGNGPDVCLRASPRGLTGLAVFWQEANRCNVHIILSNIGQFSNFKNESPSAFSDSNNETLIF